MFLLFWRYQCFLDFPGWSPVFHDQILYILVWEMLILLNSKYMIASLNECYYPFPPNYCYILEWLQGYLTLTYFLKTVIFWRIMAFSIFQWDILMILESGKWWKKHLTIFWEGNMFWRIFVRQLNKPETWSLATISHNLLITRISDLLQLNCI